MPNSSQTKSWRAKPRKLGLRGSTEHDLAAIGAEHSTDGAEQRSPTANSLTVRRGIQRRKRANQTRFSWCQKDYRDTSLTSISSIQSDFWWGQLTGKALRRFSKRYWG